MTTRNKLDKAFGPVGTSAGIFLFIAGIGICFFSLRGLILIVLGAFVGFTSTRTSIDLDNKRARFSNNIFGLFPIGQWIDIETNMKLGIKKSNKTWRAYSRGNRTLDLANTDYRIVLFDSKGREILPLQKLNNPGSAKLRLNELSEQLGLNTI